MNGERGTLEMRRLLLLRWRLGDRPACEQSLTLQRAHGLLQRQCLAANQRGHGREILAGDADAAFHQRKRPGIAAGVALRLEEVAMCGAEGARSSDSKPSSSGICFSPRA